ncbi:MAG TPA: PAAR domain-containing protein [Myxococcales bacterium]|nr:PAAR domain-containing protein [Myxococcales bacterium]
MPGAARLGDKAQTQADAHGCPGCPHPGVGPIISGSPDVNINSRPAARKDDPGVHAACCGPNTFTIAAGSATVYVNGKPLARMQDNTSHCGGSGPIIEGSADVCVDDGAGAAEGIAAAAIEAVKILLEKTARSKEKKAKKASDTHQGSEAKPAKDLARDAKEAAKEFAILSARWGVQRAVNGQEVELLIECAEPKGQLQIEIWAQGADRSQDQKVKSDSAGAAKSVRKKVKLEIPPEAAPANECHFYFLVKGDQGPERRSDTLFVDRTPFRFSI